MPAGAGNSLVVVADGSRTARDEGAVENIAITTAVTEIGVWIVVVIVKVPTVNIVHEPITVVVNAVARNLAGVRPYIVGQIGVLEGDAGIDHGNHDV